MNLIELNAIKKHLKTQLLELESIETNCRRCEHLQHGLKCQKFDAKPPADWLIGSVDCDNWTWDQIPF